MKVTMKKITTQADEYVRLTYLLIILACLVYWFIRFLRKK